MYDIGLRKQTAPYHHIHIKKAIQKKKPAAHVYAEELLNSLPKMTSHYCRSSTSRQYLEPLFQNMGQLYKELTSKCELESVECRRIFDNIFLKFKIQINLFASNMVIGLLHVNKVRTCFAGGAACKLSIQDLHYYCSIIT